MSPAQRKSQLAKIYQSFLKSTQKHSRLKFLLIILIIPSFLLITFAFLLFKDVPNPTSLTKSPAPVSTKILDRYGELLYEVYTEQKRDPIQISTLPSYVKDATISIEDKNFYHHHGVDITGIIRAAFNTLTGKRLEGGSTITQQLVKNSLLSDTNRNLVRKIREAALSIITELAYSKDQILELYLNSAPYGGAAYGIESASQAFFNKHAKDLSLPEATLLAGLPQSPTRYSPFGAHPTLAIDRQSQVLRRMVEDGYITQKQADDAKTQKLTFATKAAPIRAPHFALMVRDLLVNQYGEDTVNLGGLRVTTTLDIKLQDTAQASLSAELKRIAKLKISNGAALVTKPNTGEILAMIGSRDYFDTDNDGNVNVTKSLRQPGSSIKPVNYAVGLMKGWTTSTMFLDVPTCFTVLNQKEYCPKNYDNSFRGPVQFRFALGNSLNIPAVKQLALNGIEDFIATASAMGITSWTDQSRYGLSLTLGGGEVTMIDMATAFGTFANAGITVPLSPILKVETFDGKLLQENHPQDTADYVGTLHQDWGTFWQRKAEESGCPPEAQVQDSLTSIKCIHASLPEEVAYIISHILLDNNARMAAFGPSSQLVIPGKTVSVKTGTTNDLRDNWTIGYTPDFLVATWVGNNDNTPMSYVTSGVTGASPIWNQIMRRVLKDQKDHFPTQPAGVEYKNICSLTGLTPTGDNPCETRSELFIKDIYPPNNVPAQKQIWVRRSDKYPLLPNDTTVDLDLELHIALTDPFVKDFCLDCNYTVDDKGQRQFPVTTINYNQFQINPPRPNTYISQ